MIKILIAEDEAIVAADLEHSLRRLGYEVVGSVAQGREAIDLARDHRPDVVLMDIELKGPIDGIAAAEHIRKVHDLPVVYLTAYSDPATMERARLTEPFGYILKPFEVRELRTSIEMARYRHRIDRRLREVQEDLNRAQSVAHVGSWRLNAHTRTLLWSDETWRIFGIPKISPLTYEIFLDAVHPEERAFVEASWAAALRGAPFDIEHRIVVDGRVKWVRERAEIEFDADGHLLGSFGTTQDVTDFRNAQQALREAHARAKWLARFPGEDPGPVLRVTADGTVLYANPAAVGNPAWTCGSGEHVVPPLRALVERAMEARAPIEEDVELEGATYAVSVAVFPEERYVNLYGRDVTERKRAEEAVLRAKQEWERTFDSVPDLISILDSDHRIVRANRAMAERLGRTPKQCIGIVCYEGVHGCARPIQACPHERTMHDGQTHFADVHEERLGGDFLVTTTPLKDADGRMVGAIHIAHDITERKRVEMALRASEERYRTLFSAMTEGFALHEIVCDSEGRPCDYRFLDINPAFETLTGLKRADVVGRTVLEVLPETEPAWIERFGRVALTGDPDFFEHAHGQLGRHYSVNAYHMAPGRFAAIFNDVTELRTMQQREMTLAIQLAWGQSASEMINAMHEGVALLERDGTILSVNPAAERMIGRRNSEVVGRKIGELLREFLGEDDLGQVMDQLAAFRRGDKPAFRPLQLRRQDGANAVHVLPSLTMTSAPQGSRRLAVLTLRDVTELHDAWEERARNERNYRELVENAGSIIMRVSPDHTITFFNEYAQRFFGFTAAEVLGRNVIGTITPAVDSEDHDLREMLRDITAHPEMHASNDNENQCKDGRRVWVHWTNRAIRDPQGCVVEILCVGTDISLRRKMEAEAKWYHRRLRELTERLAATEEEERWRISRFVHDTIIQNLSLSSIRLASMAKPLADAGLPEEVDKLRRVRTLVEDAIDECRRVMSDLTPALLYELGLVPALHDLARQLESKHDIQIRVDSSGQELFLPPPLRGFLFQAARELVMNSLKYAGPCRISVTLSSSDGRLTLGVADNGRGFDPAIVDATRNHKGGFGLFNIRQRLEGMDGRIDIRSAPEKGTTATISVPLA